MSALAVTSQTWAERDVVVTPAPPRTQTARAVEVRSVTTQPAPAVTKPAVAPVAAPVVKTPEPEKKTDSFFQGLLDRWFPKR